MKRRTALILAGSMAAPAIHAQEAFPGNRTLTLTVGFAPGGVGDMVMRQLSESARAKRGVQTVVDFRPGAGSALSLDRIARATPDGTQVALGSVSALWIIPQQQQLGYDPRQLTGLGQISGHPLAVYVKTDSPLRSWADLLAYARANPGKLNYASAGNGSINHVGTEHFMALAGIQMTHIPYRGAGPAQNDLVAGKVDLAFDSGPACVAHVQAGRLRALAVSFRRRSRQLPEVPLFAEAGMPNYANNSWNLLMAPSGTPSPVMVRLNAALNATLTDPETRARFEAGGTEVAVDTTPEAAARFVAAQRATWVPVARGLGLVLN